MATGLTERGKSLLARAFEEAGATAADDAGTETDDAGTVGVSLSCLDCANCVIVRNDNPVSSATELTDVAFCMRLVHPANNGTGSLHVSADWKGHPERAARAAHVACYRCNNTGVDQNSYMPARDVYGVDGPDVPTAACPDCGGHRGVGRSRGLDAANVCSAYEEDQAVVAVGSRLGAHDGRFSTGAWVAPDIATELLPRLTRINDRLLELLESKGTLATSTMRWARRR